MKMDLKKMMRILAEKQLSEMEEDTNESENEMDDMEDENEGTQDDKLKRLQSRRPKLRNQEMQNLAEQKRKAMILLMLKNKRANK